MPFGSRPPRPALSSDCSSPPFFPPKQDCMIACQEADDCESFTYNAVLMQCFLKREQASGRVCVCAAHGVGIKISCGAGAPASEACARELKFSL